MPKLNADTKEQIKRLDKKALQDIVIKMASRDKTVFDYVKVNYLDKEFGEDELFEETKADLQQLFSKQYKGFAEQLRVANMLSACIKRVNEFTKVSKNKVLEAELLIFILDYPFSLPDDFFGTAFTKFDTKVATIVKRLITLVTKRLHEDYKLDYKNKINGYLEFLHRNSNHNDTVYNLPLEI